MEITRVRKERIISPTTHTFSRIHIVLLAIYIGIFGIVIRLGYWQIIKGPELQAVARAQYTGVQSLSGNRGDILTTDGSILVGNKDVYTLFAQPQILKQSAQEIVEKILPILLPEGDSTAAKERAELLTKLSNPEKKWVSLYTKLTPEQKESIQALDIFGLGFDVQHTRSYPEGSMAAQLTGFVGKNEQGVNTGYFGIEGKLDLELRGKPGKIIRELDAHGTPIALGDSQQIEYQPGRDIVLSIHRDLQYMLENKLATGMKKYDAVSAEAIVMDVQTGDILAMASLPSYDQTRYSEFTPELYKNPLAAEAYEPGSTFKVLTVATGIDTGKISPDTQCDTCASARKIAGYTIKTWNDTYTPNITMREALTKSDNTAMIFIAEKVGTDQFVEYLKKFHIGQKTGVEIQEETASPLRKSWKPIDLATSSFGQGIAVTGMQMIQSVNAIANNGVMVRPKLVQAVRINGENQPVKTEIVGQPISPETAHTVKQMMIEAAQHGEAQWTASKKYSVAGKTGTAQIPVAGHYDEDKTIASYIGFAPASSPKFIMLVKLKEPKSSPWAAETAAPLWYDIANELFMRMNILPDRE